MTIENKRVSAARRVITVAALLVLTLAVQMWRTRLDARASGTNLTKSANAEARAMVHNLPLAFEPNRGQTDQQVKWVTRGTGYTAFLTDQEAVVLMKTAAKESVARIKFAGASAKSTQGAEKLNGHTNYYGGVGHVIENVPNYGAVRYGESFPGVDTIFKGDNNNLRFDYVVKPGADPKAIEIAYSGVKNVQIRANGDLALDMGAGTLIQRKPYIYQEVRGKRIEVAGGYQSLDGGKIGFELGAYDKSRELIIDPTFGIGTYVGGTGTDEIRGIAVDATNVYAVGDTTSTVFPASNPLADKPGTSNFVAFAFILARTGIGPAYTKTYIGTTTNTYARGVVLGTFNTTAPASDEVMYVVGDTVGGGGQFQASTNTFAGTAPASGGTGAFIAAVDTGVGATGTAGTLDFGGYLGNGNSGSLVSGNAIADDGTGIHIWAGGSVNGQGFPNTAGGLQVVYQGGNTDGYVAYSVVTPGATATAATIAPGSLATYLGGSGNDVVNGLAYNQGTDDLIVVGATTSTASGSFPSTFGSFQSQNGGGQDGFIVSVPATPGGANLSGVPVFGAFYGGPGTESVNGVALDSTGNIYITGQTTSSTGIASASNSGPIYQNTLNGASDAFVAKITQGGSGLTWSTYLGGSSDDLGTAIAVDTNANVYVVGQTASNNFPTPVSTVPATQPLQANTSFVGPSAPFIARLSSTGAALNYAGIDGSANSIPAAGTSTGMGAMGIVLDSTVAPNTAFVGGISSGGLITAGNAFENSYIGGTSDGFITSLKFNDIAIMPNNNTLSFTVNNGTPVAATLPVTLAFTNAVPAVTFGAIQYSCGAGNPAGFTSISAVGATCSATPWLVPVGTLSSTYNYPNLVVALNGAANSLPAGNYTATFTINGNFDNNPQTMTVNLRVNQQFNTISGGTVTRQFQKYYGSPNVIGTNTITPNVDSFSVTLQSPPTEAYTATLTNNDATGPNTSCNVNWITSVTPTNPATGTTGSTSLVITYNAALLESMDITNAEGAPAAPQCTQTVTLSAPNNASADLPNYALSVVVQFTSRIIPSCASSTSTITCTTNGATSEMAYQTSAPTVPIFTQPLVFNFVSNAGNVPAQSQIISLQADGLQVPIGSAVVTNNETGCSIPVSVTPVLGGPAPYNIPDNHSGNTLSFSVTANPTGCNNNTSYAFGNGNTGSLVSFVPTGAARSAVTNIPVIINVGNVITTTASGVDVFTGPSTGGYVADTPNGYAESGESISTDCSASPATLPCTTVTLPSTNYSVAVGNINQVNSYAYQIQVDALGATGGGACSGYGNQGTTTATATAGNGVTSGWLTATPSLTNASNAANSIITFTMTPGTWANLPATANGCGYEATVTVLALNGDASGSPSTTYDLFFTKTAQITTSATLTSSVNNLTNGAILFQGPVGQGLLAPSTISVGLNAAGSFTADATTNVLAGTSYPGYNYPDRSCNPGSSALTTTTDSNVWVAGACGQSWLQTAVGATTACPSNSNTQVCVTANTTNLTPSPTQTVPGSGTCPAGTVLVSTVTPNVCATPYTGTVRLRTGVSPSTSPGSGQNVVEIPVDFVVVQAPALTLSSSNPAGSSSAVTFANFVAQSNLAPESATIAPQTITVSSSGGATTPLPYTAILGPQSFAASCAGGTLFTLTAAPGGQQNSTTSVGGTASTAANITVTANTACAATLAPGNYSTSLAVNAPTASVQNQSMTVSLTVVGAPVLSTVPLSLTPYTWTIGSPVPSNSQTLTVSSGNTAFTSAFVPTTGGNWITLTNSTTTPTIALNSAVVSTLAAGNYSGNVVITDANTSNSPLSVPVTLTVNSQSVITPAPTSASFTWQIGTAIPATQQILLTVSGQPIPLSYAVSQTTTSNSVNWLTNSSVQLSTSQATNAATLTVGVVPTGMAAGTYSGTVTVSSPNVASVVIPVNLTVTSMATVLINGNSSATFSAAYTLGNSTASTPICAPVYTVSGNTNGLIITPVVATNNGGANWIGPITQTGGTTPTQITVCVTPSQLASQTAGTYTGTVTMTSPNATSAVVNVSLAIEPQPVLTASAVNYTGVWANPAPASQPADAISISSTPAGGATNLTISGTSGACSWVNLSLSATSTPANLVTSINSANYLNLVPGVYMCTVTISGTGGTPSAPAVSASVQVGLTINALPGFTGAVNGGNGTLFLQFPGANTFGYFGYLTDNWMYHVDLGYEYFIAANDGANGFYMYDQKSGHFWYSNPATFPYLYDFTLRAWLYYFPNQNVAGHYTTNPRYFANLTTNQIITM